jgi:hypothetical protein
VVERRLTVPDFATGALTIAPVLVVPRVEEESRRDRRHPLDAFRIGGTRYVPRFGNAFTRDDSVSVVYQFYDARPDAGSHKPSASARVRILAANQVPIAEGPEDTFDTPVGGTVVGPMSLAKCTPGTYTIEVRVFDRVGGKTYIRRSTFQVVADVPVAAAGIGDSPTGVLKGNLGGDIPQ